jgi:hypothetical protein
LVVVGSPARAVSLAGFARLSFCLSLSFSSIEISMFQVLVYAIALLLVLWFAEQRPAPQTALAIDAEAEAIAAQLSQIWLDAEVPEFLEIGTFLEFHIPEYDLNLPAAQLRALAEIYGVPCSKRGRISASTLAQLAEVG